MGMMESENFHSELITENISQGNGTLIDMIGYWGYLRLLLFY